MLLETFLFVVLIFVYVTLVSHKHICFVTFAVTYVIHQSFRHDDAGYTLAAFHIVAQLSQVLLTLYLLGVKKELNGVNSATLHGVNGRLTVHGCVLSERVSS